MNLIVINGPAGSGKDTVGKLIEKHANARCIAFADPMKTFAATVFGFSPEQLYGPSTTRNAEDPRWGNEDTRRAVTMNYLQARHAFLMEVVPPHYDALKIFNVGQHLDRWFTTVLSKATLTPRYVLQTLGTEWGRETVDDAIWIKYAVRRATAILAVTGHKYVVITDCRFENEATLSKQLGATIWRVKRSANHTAAAQNAGVVGHRSETEQLSAAFEALVDVDLDNNGTLEELEQRVADLVRHG